MSEKLYGVDQFYPGDFAQILTGVYTGRFSLLSLRTFLHLSTGVEHRPGISSVHEDPISSGKLTSLTFQLSRE